MKEAAERESSEMGGAQPAGNSSCRPTSLRGGSAIFSLSARSTGYLSLIAHTVESELGPLPWSPELKRTSAKVAEQNVNMHGKSGLVLQVDSATWCRARRPASFGPQRPPIML